MMTAQHPTDQPHDVESPSDDEILQIEIIPSHEFIKVPHRFNIMLILYMKHNVDFSLLKNGLNLTSGNLDHHLKVLIAQGWVEEKKYFPFRRVKIFSLTEKGRMEFKTYSEIIQNLLKKL